MTNVGDATFDVLRAHDAREPSYEGRMAARMQRTTGLVAPLVMAALVVTGCASTGQAPAPPVTEPAAQVPLPAVRTVAAFDAARGENAENLEIAPDGAVYVSLVFAGVVERIEPNGRRSRITLDTAGGLVSGLAIDPQRPTELAVGVRSTDSSVAGIWSVPITAFNNAGVAPIRAADARRAALPVASFANGMDIAPDGSLYVADSDLATIWRIGPGATTAEAWLQDPQLAPTGEPFGPVALPGANGLKIFDEAVYVANTGTNRLLRTAITDNGQPGAIEQVLAGVRIDDFAVVAPDEFYLALNNLDQVVRYRPGEVTVLASRSTSDTQGPSAVAIAETAGGPLRLYITTSAYVSNPARPALQVVEV